MRQKRQLDAALLSLVNILNSLGIVRSLYCVYARNVRFWRWWHDGLRETVNFCFLLSMRVCVCCSFFHTSFQCLSPISESGYGLSALSGEIEYILVSDCCSLTLCFKFNRMFFFRPTKLELLQKISCYLRLVRSIFIAMEPMLTLKPVSWFSSVNTTPTSVPNLANVDDLCGVMAMVGHRKWGHLDYACVHTISAIVGPK